MSLTPEQLALRRTMITGSNIAAIVGADPQRGPFDVYVEIVDGWVREPTGPMEAGRFFEQGVADWYAHRYPACRFEAAPGTVRHPDFERVGCTPDRIVNDNANTFDLSIKVPTPFGSRQYGEHGTDQVPLHSLIQLQWELVTLRRLGLVSTGFCQLAAPVDGDLRIYDLKEDIELQGLLLEAGARFWKDFIEPKRPPDLDGSATANDWLAKRFRTHGGTILDSTAADEVLGLELKEACEAYDAAEKRKDLAKQRLKERIGEAQGLALAPGLVSWRANKLGVRSLRHPFTKSNGRNHV